MVQTFGGCPVRLIEELGKQRACQFGRLPYYTVRLNIPITGRDFFP
jgi:hypothetical protein